MGQFEVLQRTKDGMFNATALIRQWNTQPDLHTQKSGYVKKKDLDDYLSNKNTKLFIQTIIKRENLHSSKKVCLKSRASRGDNAGTWMHPLLFIDFAMWINPAFKYDVLKFVADQMIKYRNDAGDAYRELGSAVQKIVDRSWMPIAMKNIAKALNFIVFGNHGREMRNKQGDEVKMRELFELERQIALLVNDGFLKNYNALIEYLRRKWKDKYLPSVLRS